MQNSSLFIPDFLKIQRESFRLFLKKGLICELNKKNPIITTHQGDSLLELRFYSEYYRLTSPPWTPQQAILKKKNYSARIYVPVQLINHKKKQIYIKWILLASLPLMTKRGHFIINGSTRIIINQIARSPGIYFNKTTTKNEEGEKKIVYADIIPLRGTWLRLEIDKNRRIWAKMKATPAIPALVFLQALNIEISTILQTIEYINWFKKRKEEDLTATETRKEAETSGNFYQEYFDDKRDVAHFLFSKNSNIASKILAKFVYPKAKEQELSAEIGKIFLERKFLNSRIYDLGLLGRLNLNKRFNKAILNDNYTKIITEFDLMVDESNRFYKSKGPTTDQQMVTNYQTTLTGQDVLFAFTELIKIACENKRVDDIDDLKNRRLRTAGELIQTQFATGLIRLEKFITEQISQNCFVENKTINGEILKNTYYNSTKTTNFMCSQLNTNIKINKIIVPRLEKLFNVKPINSALQEFFGLNPLSQFMDQTNPLAEITHKRRLTSLGPGGVDRETAGMAIRGIHSTHYGRICPIETPEGQNAGLVNSITTQGYVDSFGYLKTPFYKIYKGQVQRELGPLFLSSEQEKIFPIVPGDIFLNSIDILPGKNPFNKIKASNSRVVSNYKIKYQIPIRQNHEFKRVFRETGKYMIISPIQMISIATSLIPFLEHDDANRALMGSNMQRQAVPLIYSTRPIVGTGLESRTVSDSGQVALSPVIGLIAYVSSKKIFIYTGFFQNRNNNKN